MKITKDIFFRFLKENNFYDAWIEGYNIDNEVYNHVVSLDEFFAEGYISPHLWLYSGPGALAMLSYLRTDASDDLKKRYHEWREKFLTQNSELDEKWIDDVRLNQ